MKPTPATRAAFARLCLAEADWIEPAQIGDDERQHYGEPDQPAYLRRLASGVDRITYLHRRASTLEEAQELLTARGMPELGAYLCRVLLPNVHPDRREVLLQEKALLLFAGTIPGARAFREKSPEQVAEALRWVLDVCRRGRAEALRSWAARGRNVKADLPCEVCGRLYCDGCPMARRDEMKD